MSTTSTFFSLVLATTSDQVNVVTHVANNFNSIDAILSRVHTGTGQLKSNLAVSNWTMTNPTIVGTLTGGTIVSTTGRFQTLTATGATLTASTFAIGTYSYPTTVGATGALLTVVTGNAVWASPSGGTGANTGLSNLASVAINTSINTFTGGFATLDRVLATSGALTGLTVFQASTGTFAGNLAVTGTINASVLNVTGGAITAAGFAIGTYGLPSTVGAVGQVLGVTTGNAVWITKTQTSAYVAAYPSTSVALPGINAATGEVTIWFDEEVFDTASIFNASTTANQLTVTASGYYFFDVAIPLQISATTGDKYFYLVLIRSSGNQRHTIGTVYATSGQVFTSFTSSLGVYLKGSRLLQVASGDKFNVNINPITGSATVITTPAGSTGFAPMFTVYKVPDM